MIALQLGEFADHQRAQVGLRQARGALDMRDVDAEFLRERDGQPGHALDALELRAELVVIDDARQSGDAALERGLAVLLVEELRVGQARAHHARVAGDDRRRIAGLDVATTRGSG